MLQSIHAILHNILLQELHFYKGTVQYSILHIILILQCSCEQVYFQAFLFQNCIAEIHNQQVLHSTRRIPVLQCIQFPHVVHRVRNLRSTFCQKNYNSSSDAPRLQTVACTQTTCSLHPLKSTTQPTHKKLSSWRICTFYKKEPEQHAAQQNKDSTRRSLNATGI